VTHYFRAKPIHEFARTPTLQHTCPSSSRYELFRVNF